MTIHICHHPDCKVPVPPKMLACQKHWFALPRPLRAAVWAAYRPGQEVDKRPSDEYLAVILEVMEFWRNA